MVAAARARTVKLALAGPQLRFGEIDRLVHIVQRSLPDKALMEKFGVAAQLRARVVQVHLRLAHGLRDDRFLHLAQLPQASPRLRYCRVGLRERGRPFGALEFDQHLARAHSLSFGHGHALHRAGDLGSDIHAMRRLDMTACHDRLNEVTPHHGRCLHARAEYQPGGQPEADRQNGCQREPDGQAGFDCRPQVREPPTSRRFSGRRQHGLSPAQRRPSLLARKRSCSPRPQECLSTWHESSRAAT